jgi:hypothetical protein
MNPHALPASTTPAELAHLGRIIVVGSFCFKTSQCSVAIGDAKHADCQCGNSAAWRLYWFMLALLLALA